MTITDPDTENPEGTGESQAPEGTGSAAPETEQVAESQAPDVAEEG